MAVEPAAIDPFKIAQWFCKWDFGPLHQTKYGLFNVNVYAHHAERNGNVDIGTVNFVAAHAYNRVRMSGDLVVNTEGAFEVKARSFHVTTDPVVQANSKLLSSSFKNLLDTFAEIAIKYGS